jgi:hypothetical protein
MATTYEAIATVTVGSGGAANIEFTSIPATYTDLVVKISARNTSTFANIRWTINGTTTGYSERMLYNSDGTAYSTSASGNAYFQLLYQTTSSLTASTFNSAEIYIPNYAGSNNKSISIDNTQENNGTTILQNLTAALWSNISAINALSFGTSGGNFAQYSTATLYGISNS